MQKRFRWKSGVQYLGSPIGICHAAVQRTKTKRRCFKAPPLQRSRGIYIRRGITFPMSGVDKP